MVVVRRVACGPGRIVKPWEGGGTEAGGEEIGQGGRENVSEVS